MKQLLYTLLTGLFLFSCSQPEESITLRFNLDYDGEPLAMFTDVDYPDGRKMQFQRISFYISDLNVNKDGVSTMVSEVDYLDMTSSHSNPSDIQPTILEYFAEDYPNYDQLNFTIGLSEEQNNSKPEDFSSNSALARTGEYWPGWESYVYAKLEGNIDMNSDGEYGAGEAFILHIGSTGTARDITMNLDEKGQETIDFTLDVDKVFKRGSEIYDIDNFPQIHQLNDANIARMNWLMDNLSGAVSVN